MTKDDIEAGGEKYTQYCTPQPESIQQDHEPLKKGEYRGASIPKLLIIAMPRMAIQMAWSAQWAALGPYLNTMLPNYAVQLTQVIGPLSGILVAPTVGVLSDRSLNKWGRRRPFLLYAAIASVICWIMMGFTRQIGEALGDYGTGKEGDPTSRTWTAFFTVFFYTWMDITVNIVQTPAFLMIADFAGERQTTGAAIGQGWATLGAILVSGYIELIGPAHTSLGWFLGMLAVVMLVSVGLVCIFIKEEPLEADNADRESTAKRIGQAFGSIITGLKTLPHVLMVYCVIFFCLQYGFTAYNGNKGQFFGIEVYGGTADGADKCDDTCSPAQKAYNHGVQVAGGSTDLMFNLVGYAFSWILPFCVAKVGAKWVLAITLLPQSLLMVMAFSKIVELNVFIVVITTLSQGTVFALLVPVIVHVFGEKADIGMYVGALNSANCIGQLLNFIIGAALVESSLGYKLPVFIGGVMSFIGMLIAVFFFKIKMYSL